MKLERSKALRIFAGFSAVVVAGWLMLALFEPGLDYKLTDRSNVAVDSPEMVRVLEALGDARIHRHNHVEVHPNGEDFYEAELAAIRSAKASVDQEAYIFEKGQVAQRFIDALAERARAGVSVNVTVDAMGSLSTPKEYFKPLLDAGGKVEWYHPLRWNTWTRFNNRTHRELLIVDGDTAFIGGAGIADHWLIGKDKEPRWRDTMVRVDGDAVAGLQGVFVENWLESSGEVLMGKKYFPFAENNGATSAIVIGSTPSMGQSTKARILYQALLGSAQHTIHITTPYFLPDRSARDEMVRAIKRGVKIVILVPGKRSDHSMTRSSSRALYGDLLEAGAEIHEYQPAMIHAKILIVDGLWSIVGSTNVDSRSFGLNDEVNLAALDPVVAQRLESDFQNDLSQSRNITYDEWKRRPVIERIQGVFGWILARQQ